MYSETIRPDIRPVECLRGNCCSYVYMYMGIGLRGFRTVPDQTRQIVRYEYRTLTLVVDDVKPDYRFIG